LYLVRVLEPEGKTWLDRPVKPVERLIYRILGIDPKVEQDWRRYTLSLIVFSLAGMLLTYAVLRLQHLLPLNPQKFGPVGPDLAFNTAASFTTNTNWQNYAGESTLSYFSQMVGLVFHNFISSAVGIATAAALVRGIARHSAKTIGNFWVDVVRINLYLLLPFSIVFALFLSSQGIVQNFKPYVGAVAVESAAGQTIAQGPAASQVAIKMLGTNGGGFFNANAAHPYENPTPLSNFFQMLSIFLIPSGLTYYLGRKVKNQKHGWAVWSAMAILFLAAVLVCWRSESAGNPRLQALGIDPAGGNMEGKEVRFGVFNSSLFATVTTAASCGAVNSTHDSFTPLGGLVPLVNIQLGEVVFGGVGSGLYGMLVFVILAVFLTGLMVGRTPEYLGKKIESYDVKVSVLAVLILIFSILGFSAWATASRWGLAGLANKGPHGLSEILYAFSSGTGNNGSAFGGLNGNTPFYNITLALAMLFGRFIMMVPILALAGNMARKRLVPASEASFPASGPTFVIILIGTVLIVGALTFLPALALGPIVEHLLMTGSGILY
ncbi:MAG: potassium-transporting ATPase subunit KdpA, partial [Candidatus Aminicenantales bacterium]